MLRLAMAVAVALAGCDVIPETYECYYDDPCGTGEVKIKPAGISLVCARDTDEAQDVSDENLSKKFGCPIKSYNCHVLEDADSCLF